MHLLWEVWILFFKFLVKLGYHAKQAYWKCCWVSALQSSCLVVGVKNVFFRQGNFRLLLILFITESIIVSPDIISFSMDPKHFSSAVWFVYFYLLYLVFWDFYYEFSCHFQKGYLENQSQIFSKSSFSWFTISLMSLIWLTRRYHQHKGKRLTVCGMLIQDSE